MNAVAELLLSFVAGGAMSVFYFGGLWFTVQRAVSNDRPRTLLLISFAVRSGLVVLGFYLVILVSGDRWPLLVSALVGFIATRTLLMWYWRPPQPATT